MAGVLAYVYPGFTKLFETATKWTSGTIMARIVANTYVPSSAHGLSDIAAAYSSSDLLIASPSVSIAQGGFVRLTGSDLAWGLNGGSSVNVGFILFYSGTSPMFLVKVTTAAVATGNHATYALTTKFALSVAGNKFALEDLFKDGVVGPKIDVFGKANASLDVSYADLIASVEKETSFGKTTALCSSVGTFSASPGAYNGLKRGPKMLVGLKGKQIKPYPDDAAYYHFYSKGQQRVLGVIKIGKWSALSPFLNINSSGAFALFGGA